MYTFLSIYLVTSFSGITVWYIDIDRSVRFSPKESKIFKYLLPTCPQSRLVRVLLQGSDRLYLNTTEGLMGASSSIPQDSLSLYFDDDEEGAFEDRTNTEFNVAANKQWIVVPIPYKYTSSNWPVRVSQLTGVFQADLPSTALMRSCIASTVLPSSHILSCPWS